jgi:type II secretory pathway component GspD/PulD (secretin)
MRAELLINKYDIDLADTFTEIFEIRHRDPEEIVQMLETLISYGSGSTMNPMSMFGNMPTSINIGGIQTRTNTNRSDRNRTDNRTRGGNRGSSTQTIRIPGITQGGATSVNVQTVQSQPLLIAETRNKWIIARATEKDMELIRYWINKLDSPVNIVWDVKDLVAIENKNQIVQYFFQLQYYSPEQMLQIIQPMLGDSGYASAEENTGTLLVIDTVENLLNFQGIIDRFDSPQGDDNAQAIIEVKNGDPTEIVQLIRILLGEDTSNSRTITGRTTTNRNFNTTTRNR